MIARVTTRRKMILLTAVILAAVVYQFDLVGRVAYAMERGRIRADQDHLATISLQDVAPLEKVSRAFNVIVRAIQPSVVNIRALSHVSDGDEDGASSHHGFGSSRITRGEGSGVLIDDDGHIVTNNHVVSKADRIDVTLADGRTFKAKVIGADRMTDVAVVQIGPVKTHAAAFADSDAVEVGDIVLAIGSPFRLSHTVSHGIISALGRTVDSLDIDYQNFLQTDAPINPGNSGGPLLNARGEVIGINTAIATDSGGYQGISFAIPSNKVRSIAAKLMSGKPIARGYLGISIGDLTDSIAASIGLEGNAGAVVQGILADSPAAKSGLKAGDIILEINGKAIHNRSQLSDLIAGSEPTSDISVVLWRDRQRYTKTVRLGEQPQDFTTRVRGAGPAERDDDGDDDEADNTAPDEAWNFSDLGMHAATLNRELAGKLQIHGVKKGAVVTDLDPTGDAWDADLRVGDVIVRVNQQEIGSAGDLRRALNEKALRAGVRLQIEGRGGEHFVGLRVR